MLDSLRKAANTWVAKLLLGLLVVSFAIWGISGQLFTGVGNDVLTAGRTSVSMLDFRLAYDRRVREISNSLGTRLTRQQAAALGVEDQVLAELAAGAALDETARRIGLGVSQDRLAQLAASDPAFRGANGRFDRNQFEYILRQIGMSPQARFDRSQFEYILRQIGMSPQAYLANQEKAVMRSQIVDAVAEGVTPPDLLLRNVALYRGEDRTVEYVALPRSLVEPIEPPQEDVLKSWFEERKNDYAAPEYRRIDYVKLEAEDIADPSVISDEQVKAAYEQQKARYTKPERRTIEQLTFSDKEAAAAARESLRAGTTFEDLVEREGRTLEDVSLGSLARGEIADDAIAEAAFSLAEGQVSDVVDGVFGPVLLRVSKIEPETVTPLEEVRDEIRQELALEEASRLVIDTYDAYEDARAGGATLQEAAEQLNLTVRTIEAVDSEGLGPDGTAVTNIPRVRELIQEAFQTEVGVENSPIAIGSNGFLFYEVSEVIPARERTFEEVHDKVLADWTEAEAVARLSARAKELEKELEDGKSLDEIAAEIGQEKLVKRGIKREANDPDIGRAGVEAVFAEPKGGVGIFPNPTGQGQYLFKITEVFEPASASAESLPDEVVESITQGIENDLLDQLVARLQAEHEVTVNRTAMQQALNF